MLETSVRLLRLLSLMQSRRSWAGAELAGRLEVSTRTVRNDIERLRILGYQVDSTTGTAGGYRLAAGSELPPLLLDDDEAVAVAFGLSTAASGTVTGIEETSQRALAKLEQTLPSRLRHRIDTLRSATVSAAGGGPTVDAAILTVIANACGSREQLRFDYADRDGNTTVRKVEPYRLVYTGHRWYLLAWDLEKGDWRTFRADRIQPRIPTGPRFAPREPPEGDAGTHVIRGVSSQAWRIRARLLFRVPATVVAAQVTPPTGLLTPIDDHSCSFETGANSLHDLAVYFGMIDLPFVVVDPPELRDLVRTLADRFTAVAQASADL